MLPNYSAMDCRIGLFVWQSLSCPAIYSPTIIYSPKYDVDSVRKFEGSGEDIPGIVFMTLAIDIMDRLIIKDGMRHVYSSSCDIILLYSGAVCKWGG